MQITSAHGGGGQMMTDLIRDVFAKHFANDTLAQMEDAALLPRPAGQIAFTTDSFVVTPLCFPGGDIGKLAVCGTVNDLLTRGATPRYLSAGFILEEGLPVTTLERVVASMRVAADEAGVRIVTGDTKVIEGRGGLYINTAGIGVLDRPTDISASNAADGDAVLITGDLGDHHACILTARMSIENNIRSDCAPLGTLVSALLDCGARVHTLRDITRGGLASVLHEIATASGAHIVVDSGVPLANEPVRGFCDILGLDPLYMGNEGKMAVVLPQSDAERALAALRACPYGAAARQVGTVYTGETPGVSLTTRAGGRRIIEPLQGEGLPRIC